jgi:regulator of sigma D
MFNILNFILLQIPDSTIAADVVKNVVETASTNTSGDIWDTIFKVLASTVLGVGGGYKLIEYIIKKRQERKEKIETAKLEQEKTKQVHENTLENDMFNFNKEKYLALQESNQTFQKDIINEIFTKFVNQTEWITKLHDKSIEELVKTTNEVNSVNKELYVQNDVLSNRVRNVEDRLIKNTNQIMAKLDVLIQLLSENKLKKND